MDGPMVAVKYDNPVRVKGFEGAVVEESPAATSKLHSMIGRRDRTAIDCHNLVSCIDKEASNGSKRVFIAWFVRVYQCDLHRLLQPFGPNASCDLPVQFVERRHVLNASL